MGDSSHRAWLMGCLVSLLAVCSPWSEAEQLVGPVRTETEVEMGKDLYRRGLYQEAADAFSAALAVDSANPAAERWHDLAFIRSGQLTRSEALDRAVALLDRFRGPDLESELGREVMAVVRELVGDRGAGDASGQQPPEGGAGPSIPRDRGGSVAPPEVDSAANERATVHAPLVDDTPVVPEDGVIEIVVRPDPDSNLSTDDGAVRPGDIVELDEVTRAPVAQRMTRPRLPPIARQRRITGMYRAQALIGLDGRVEQIRVISVPQKGLGFEEAVEEATGSWRFSPAQVDEVPVRTWVPIRIPFGG
jgi:TonB family protein